MVSTFTPNIGLELPARNDYPSTWDLPVNANFTAIDAALAGTTTVAVTNANVALTKTQAQAASIIFTGAISTPINVTMPAGQGGFFSILNGTTGNQVINFGTTAGGAALTLPPGLRYLVISDGTNVFLADQSGFPPGTPLPWLGPLPPTGFIFSYGQQVSRSIYAGIYAVFGTTFGNGNGSTTFNMPDLRGVTFAGLDNMGGTPRNIMNAVPGYGNANTLGALFGEQSHQLALFEMPTHTHPLHDPAHTHQLTDPGHLHTYTQATAVGVGSGGGPGDSVNVQANTGSSLTGITMGAAPTGITIDSQGGSQVHNNVQPTILGNWMVKT